MKKFLSILSLSALSILVSPVQADTSTTPDWLGKYSSSRTDFVNVKRIEIFREQNGNLMIKGFLVGFPDEVSIGEAVPESYTDRNNKKFVDTVLARFSSEKYKPFIVLNRGASDSNHVTSINYACYMRDLDGATIHFNGNLQREPDK
jgi:hypothetical protein